MDNKRIYVFCNEGLLGTIYFEYIKGKECYSFEYSSFALTHNLRNYLYDQDINFVAGRQFKAHSKEPYNFMCDSSPDRWGKGLILRKFAAKTLCFSQYLLNVSDVSRVGELRYKEDLDGNFLSSENDVPPLKNLKNLESAAYNYDELKETSSWRILLTSGSSLGGSRPKASFYDEDGTLYIAKFNNKNDEYDYSKVEYFTYLFAKQIGINISNSRLITISKNRSVFLTKRFDREQGKRVHYVSFMSLLNAKDGGSSNFSYLDMAELINKLSCKPKEDLKELFTRIAFNIIFHNYDDHLRNHGMLYKNGRMSLSPSFDLNVCLFKGNITIPIDGFNEDNLETLISSYRAFRLSEEEAKEIIGEIRVIINRYFDSFADEAKLENRLKKAVRTVVVDEFME